MKYTRLVPGQFESRGVGSHEKNKEDAKREGAKEGGVRVNLGCLPLSCWRTGCQVMGVAVKSDYLMAGGDNWALKWAACLGRLEVGHGGGTDERENLKDTQAGGGVAD